MDFTTESEIVLPTTSMTIDAARLRFFAKAIGENASIYTDTDVARKAGYRQIPAPPTFLFSVELECREPFAWLAAVDVHPSRVLHGEQRFEYFSIVCAGDTIVAKPRIVAYREKNKSFDILIKDTEIVRTDESPVAILHSTYLVVKEKS